MRHCPFRGKIPLKCCVELFTKMVFRAWRQSDGRKFTQVLCTLSHNQHYGFFLSMATQKVVKEKKLFQSAPMLFKVSFVRHLGDYNNPAILSVKPNLNH